MTKIAASRRFIELPTCVTVAIVVAAALATIRRAKADNSYVAFDGEKTSWHDGFDRFDYLMDDATFAIEPFKRDRAERFGIKDPPPGNIAASLSFPSSRPPATPGRGAAAIGTISRKPRSNCSNVASTSPIFRRAPR